mgnify:CR=1 FL=1
MNGNKVKTKGDILEIVLRERKRLAELGVVSIGLFGLFVLGEQHPKSDIDLLDEFSPLKHAFDNFMDLSFLLEDLLGHKDDVITPEALNPYICPHILKEVERVAIAA